MLLYAMHGIKAIILFSFLAVGNYLEIRVKKLPPENLCPHQSGSLEKNPAGVMGGTWKSLSEHKNQWKKKKQKHADNPLLLRVGLARLQAASVLSSQTAAVLISAVFCSFSSELLSHPAVTWPEEESNGPALRSAGSSPQGFLHLISCCFSVVSADTSTTFQPVSLDSGLWAEPDRQANSTQKGRMAPRIEPPTSCILSSNNLTFHALPAGDIAYVKQSHSLPSPAYGRECCRPTSARTYSGRRGRVHLPCTECVCVGGLGEGRGGVVGLREGT